MKNIIISDVTIEMNKQNQKKELSFKEKTQTVNLLDKLNVDVIEIPKIQDVKADVLFTHTIAPMIKNSVLCCEVGYSEEEVELSFNAIKDAKRPRLKLSVPTSTVQMEYVCKKKPKFVLEMIDTLTKKCVSLCDDVEFCAVDATRSEPDFLCNAIKIALQNGVKTITLCDTCGTALPKEFGEFVKQIKKDVINDDKIKLGVVCSDSMKMGIACAIEASQNGADMIKTVANDESFVCIKDFAYAIKTRGDSINITSNIDFTSVNEICKNISLLTDSEKNEKKLLGNVSSKDAFSDKVSFETDITSVTEFIKKLGYDLSADDIKKVYDEVVRVARKKPIGSKELDAIIASTALNVPSTYIIKSFVINSGNVITPTACIELEKDGKTLQGISAGDGPIDAAFLAIEQITGHHFELDDFQIQSVTEGREAVGSAIVKLLDNGRPYSGKGISTDIIGASIRAYVNALNKICYDSINNN